MRGGKDPYFPVVHGLYLPDRDPVPYVNEVRVPPLPPANSAAFMIYDTGHAIIPDTFLRYGVHVLKCRTIYIAFNA